jgi:class 3 adenylate cyclase
MEEGGPMAILFAATYPERTAGLVLYSTYAKTIWAPDYPWGTKFEDSVREAEDQARRWGTTEYAQEMLVRLAPDDQDASFRKWWASYTRFGASPSAAAALTRMNMTIDVRHVLPSIQVPSIVLHRRGRPDMQQGRYVAEHIHGARFVELDGSEQFCFRGDSEAILSAVERFVADIGEPLQPDSVLATVLFTDIVSSTERAEALGDRAWKELLGTHHATVRALLARFRGIVMDVAGDGFFARFDGPERAIRCACEIVNDNRKLGLQVRAGLHTGQCELIDGKVGGIAVHIGARVAAQALPGEVLVTSTVKDLVAGSKIRFRDRGRTNLKGVSGDWNLFRVEMEQS